MPCIAVEGRSIAAFVAEQSICGALTGVHRIGDALGRQRIEGQRGVADGLVPTFDWNAWTLPPLFQWLGEQGGVSDHELRRTFNCGVGFVLYADETEADSIVTDLKAAGEAAFVCGTLQSA